MANTLQVNGGFQLTGSNPDHAPLLRFKSDSPQVINDASYSKDFNLLFGGHNLAFTLNIPISGYDSTRMFLMF